MGGLLFEEGSGDRFLGVDVRHKDAAFGVFGYGASVDSDTRSAWHLTEYGHQALEARGLGDGYAVH